MSIYSKRPGSKPETKEPCNIPAKVGPVAHYPNWAYFCPACKTIYEIDVKWTDEYVTKCPNRIRKGTEEMKRKPETPKEPTKVGAFPKKPLPVLPAKRKELQEVRK